MRVALFNCVETPPPICHLSYSFILSSWFFLVEAARSNQLTRNRTLAAAALFSWTMTDIVQSRYQSSLCDCNERPVISKIGLARLLQKMAIKWFVILREVEIVVVNLSKKKKKRIANGSSNNSEKLLMFSMGWRNGNIPSVHCN